MESSSNMMMEMGPLILGFHLEIFLMILSGVVYFIAALFLLKPLKEERSELVGALFAFLMYQSVSMVFMGIEMHTMNLLYSNIAALAIFLGSAYMLKFVYSGFSESVRKNIFRLSIVVVFGIFIYFMRDEASQMALMHFSLWYDLVVNGIIVGGAIIIFALKITERALKVKAFGGGGGVVACCIAANSLMITGSMLLSSVFAFLAPVMILGTLFYGNKKQDAVSIGSNSTL